MSPQVFNDFFSTIGSKLHSTFDETTQLHWSLPNSSHQFKFKQLSVDEVCSHISKLSDVSKTDVLGFDAKLLRNASSELSSSLTLLFNKSLLFHNLPHDWKKARVTPIYKGSGSVEEPSNYRPISVVSHISEVFEKCVNVQLMQYFESHNLLRCDQSAFLKKHSTTTALHRLVDDLLDNMNEGMVNAICFFDLKKCFDLLITNSLFWNLKNMIF